MHRFAAAVLLGSLSLAAPTFASEATDKALTDMIRHEATRTMPGGTPVQIDSAVACGMNVLSVLTDDERQSILDGGGGPVNVLEPLNEKYRGLGARLDMCDDAALLGVDMATGPGRDALDVVIEIVVFDRIPAAETANRTGAIACLGAAFKSFSAAHRELVASEGMMLGEPTIALLEAAYPGVGGKVQECNAFLPSGREHDAG